MTREDRTGGRRSRVPRRQILRSVGAGGLGLGVTGLAGRLTGSDPGSGLSPGDTLDTAALLKQAEQQGAPNLLDVGTGLIGRFDEMLGVAGGPTGASAVSSAIETAARLQGRQFTPPGSFSIDLRDFGFDYRANAKMSKLKFEDPGKCAPADVDGMLTGGVAFALEAVVSDGDRNWETVYTARPWAGVGLKVPPCLYTGAAASADALSKEQFTAEEFFDAVPIIPDFDSVSWGPCRRRCLRDAVEPVAATVEDLVEAGVEFVTTALEEIGETITNLVRAPPAVIIPLVILVLILAFLALSSVSLVGIATGLVTVVGTVATTAATALGALFTSKAVGALAVLLAPILLRQLQSPGPSRQPSVGGSL